MDSKRRNAVVEQIKNLVAAHQITEALEEVEKAVADLDYHNRTYVLQLHALLTTILFRLGRYSEGLARVMSLERSLSDWPECDARYEILTNKGLFMWLTWDRAGALNLLRHVLDNAIAAGNDRWTAILYTRVGFMEANAGTYERAIECHQKALQLNIESGRVDDQVYVLDAMAVVHKSRAQYGIALECLGQAFERRKKSTRMEHDFSGLYANLGDILYELGQYKIAEVVYLHNLKLVENMQVFRVRKISALLGLMACYIETNRYTDVIRIGHNILENEIIEEEAVECPIRLLMVDAFRRLGLLDEAAVQFRLAEVRSFNFVKRDITYLVLKLYVENPTWTNRELMTALQQLCLEEPYRSDENARILAVEHLIEMARNLEDFEAATTYARLSNLMKQTQMGRGISQKLFEIGALQVTTGAVSSLQALYNSVIEIERTVRENKAKYASWALAEIREEAVLERAANSFLDYRSARMMNLESATKTQPEEMSEFFGSGDVFIESFRQAHAEFFERISNVPKKLSRKELELACLIRAGLGTKDCARAMRASPRTVELHRGNLRKKFNLAKSENLVAYIMQV